MFDNPGDHQFEQLLHDGILAAKNDQPRLAQSLLRQAILLNGQDARPYLWLAETTGDPQEKREYLEQAVVIDPANVEARRSLAILQGKLDPDRLAPEWEEADYIAARDAASARSPLAEDNLQEVQAQTILCPNCGGQMLFEVQAACLTCLFCGFFQTVPQEAASTQDVADGQVLDFVMPTTRGHRWAATQHRLACEQCGAVGLVEAGQKTAQCPYCGSNQLIDSVEGEELVDPQLILLMQLDEAEATRRARAWLGRGLFAPDDLALLEEQLHLRPAYFSCWIFDGSVEVRWSCEERVGGGRSSVWQPRTGVEASFFDTVLVPGVRALKPEELESLEPFNWKEGLEFQPGQVAGWPTLIYDRSLSDASLLARERVIKKVRSQMYYRVAAGSEKRNLEVFGGEWTGMTFKHVLVPLWIGAYLYRGQEFHLLINGQSGKVSGKKPRDRVKILLAVLSALLVILLLAWLAVSLSARFR